LAEALLIDGNKILFVGSNLEAEIAVDINATKIDLEGKVVFTGFMIFICTQWK
jgi:predicted amidohydrolase YtcJ